MSAPAAPLGGRILRKREPKKYSEGDANAPDEADEKVSPQRTCGGRPPHGHALSPLFTSGGSAASQKGARK